MSLIHLPESFACSHQPAKSSPPYSGILKEFYWLTVWNIAELLQEPSTQIWLENVERHWKRRDDESCDEVCRFIRTMHLLIRHHKHWLPSEMQVLNCSADHCICQIWPPVTSVCFQNWRNSRKDGNLLTTMILCALRVTGWRTKNKNSSTIEHGPWRITGLSAFLLKGTILKSDKISCSYSVVNCIRLRAFWTPLVCVVSESFSRFISHVTRCQVRTFTFRILYSYVSFRMGRYTPVSVKCGPACHQWVKCWPKCADCFCGPVDKMW